MKSRRVEKEQNSEYSVRKSRKGKVVDEDGFEHDDFDIGFRRQSHNTRKRIKTHKKYKP